MSDLRSRDAALVNNWYVACLSRELKRDKTLRRVIYDRGYVLFRDRNGDVACLPDRCLHRAALLSEGKVKNGDLACPYHGWVYNPDGRVVRVPSEGPDSKPSGRLCHKKVPAVEQDGAVWIWTGEGEPRESVPPFRFPFAGPEHRKDGWGHYFMITDFENEVTHLAENFMDVPHTVFVHAGWFRDAASSKVPITVETADGSVLVTYRQPDDKIGFTQKLLNPKGEPMLHTDRYIVPNITRVDYHFGSTSSFLITSQCTPVSRLKSRVYTAITFRLGWLTRPLTPFLRFYTRQVIEQDVRIMANQGRSFEEDMDPPFRSTDADVVHIAIERLRELCRQGKLDEARAFRQTVEKTIWV
jgi:phenylpropionate dioxygenase-like ring-hydroxylating dioxygenase large terminal subunit